MQLYFEDRFDEYEPLLRERIKLDDENDFDKLLKRQVKIGCEKGKVTQKYAAGLGNTS